MDEIKNDRGIKEELRTCMMDRNSGMLEGQKRIIGFLNEDFEVCVKRWNLRTLSQMACLIKGQGFGILDLITQFLSFIASDIHSKDSINIEYPRTTSSFFFFWV